MAWKTKGFPILRIEFDHINHRVVRALARRPSDGVQRAKEGVGVMRQVKELPKRLDFDQGRTRWRDLAVLLGQVG